MKKIIYSVSMLSIGLLGVSCNNDDDTINDNNNNKKLLKEFKEKFNNGDIAVTKYNYNPSDSSLNKIDLFRNDTLISSNEYKYLNSKTVTETNYFYYNNQKKELYTITHQLADDFVKSTFKYKNLDSIVNNQPNFNISSNETSSYFNNKCGIYKLISKDYNSDNPNDSSTNETIYTPKSNDCNFVSIFQEGKEIGNIQYIGVNPFPSIFDYFKVIKKGNLKSVNYYDEYLKDFNHKQDYTFDSNNYPITSTTSYFNNTSNSVTTYSYY